MDHSGQTVDKTDVTMFLKLLVLAAGMLISATAYTVDFNNAKDFDFAAAGEGQQLGCMAMNIYHEGRGESTTGRAAIAAVTMNRVRSEDYPDTICEVVWQRKQFSWTRIAPHHHVIKNEKAWAQSLVIAELFMNGARIAKIGEATHYHATSVQPSWVKSSRLIALVGGHYFYAL